MVLGASLSLGWQNTSSEGNTYEKPNIHATTLTMKKPVAMYSHGPQADGPGDDVGSSDIEAIISPNRSKAKRPCARAPPGAVRCARESAWARVDSYERYATADIDFEQKLRRYPFDKSH